MPLLSLNFVPGSSSSFTYCAYFIDMILFKSHNLFKTTIMRFNISLFVRDEKTGIHDSK